MPTRHSKFANKFSDIIHWNCRGIKNKSHELEIIVSECKAQVICLQETKLSNDQKIHLKGFDCFYKNKALEPGQHAQGGVAILASKKCSKSEIKLNTALQAVAISIKLHKRITICSFYCPPSKAADFSQAEFENLLDQLPKPFLVLGDFNAHNRLWYGKKENKRGEILEAVLNERDIFFLDKDKDTHYYTDGNQLKSSHIDLSLCSTNLLLDFEWGMFDQLMDSDHYPIWLRSGRKRKPNCFPKWVLDKANWPKFSEKAIPKMSVNEFDSVQEAAQYCKSFIIDAAKDSIPKSSGKSTEYNSPWFNEDCKTAKKDRKKEFDKFLNGLISKIEWHRARAKARQTFRWNKKLSWIQFMESINENTPSKEVWRKIGILINKYNSQSVTSLKSGNEIIDDPKSIADKIGDAFAKVSSEASCSPKFLKFKRQNSKVVNFLTKIDYIYNSPITICELEAALVECNDSAPGPDEIHNRMLKNLPEESKNYIVELFNYIFSEGAFPEDWKFAHIIPILKKDKDPLDAKNYRPISLTSCLCKLLDRILNKRLVWYLESNNYLHKSQTGSRKGRSTIDNLLMLESEVHNAFLEKMLLISIFFDLEKAYDTCWSQIVLNELYGFGLRGKLPILISDYLKNRKFQVRVGDKLSDMFNQEMGVPQGGILSVTLFIIAMNTVVNFINSEITYSIFVDDLRISILTTTLRCGQRILNLQLKRFQDWMDSTGFRFSSTKTKAVIFRRGHRSIQNKDLKLKLGNEPIEVVSEIRTLGLIVDERFTFKPHLYALKRKCLSNLNAMKLMVKYSKSGDANFLLRIYRALIRSKIDYACQVYGTAGKSYLNTMLDPIHNAALRLCTGAYRTTRKESLYIEANEPSLSNRRLLLDLQFFIRAQRIPEESKISSWEDSSFDTSYENKSNVYFKPESYGFKTRKLVNSLQIHIPQISQIRFYKSPPWTFGKINICLYLTRFIKSNTADAIFQQEFRNHKHKADIEIFTDGSKKLDKVGAGIIIKNGESIERIPLRIQDHSSVFIAELFAIRAAVFCIKDRTNLSCCIFSDSKSALQAIQCFYSNIPLVQIIQETINRCKSRNLIIQLCWVPGHVDIKGNCLADEVAKSSLKLNTIAHPFISVSDFKSILKNKIIDKWQSEWDTLVNRAETPLAEIQFLVNQTQNIPGLTRLERSKLTRLRTGHTIFSKQYLVKNEPPPVCIECNRILSVKHVLIECGNYYVQRNQFFGSQNLSMRDIFNQTEINSIRNIFGFFKEIGLYSRI